MDYFTISLYEHEIPNLFTIQNLDYNYSKRTTMT